MLWLKQSALQLFVPVLPIKNLNLCRNSIVIYKGSHLADKSTDGSKAIKILVSLDYYFESITGEVIKGKFGEPVALKSSFGYILSDQYKNDSTVNFNETHLLKFTQKQMLIFSNSLLIQMFNICLMKAITMNQ